MQRYLKCAGAMVPGDAEVLVEIRDVLVPGLALELTLLATGLAEQLTLRFERGERLVLRPSPGLQPGEKARVTMDGATVSVQMAENDIEYLQTAVLRAFRDNAAEVNHIHVEGEKEGEGYDLTFLFETYVAPMSPEQAERLMEE